MELSLKYVVAASIIIIVLVVVSLFLTTTSGRQITTGNADYVFATKCQQYGDMGCEMGVIRADSEYNNFVSACKQLFGSEKEGVSCVYSYCALCKQFEQADRSCYNKCTICGLYVDRDTTACCSDFNSRCSESSYPDCPAC